MTETSERSIETFPPATICTKTMPRFGEPDSKNLDAVGGFPEDALVVTCDGVSSKDLYGSASQGVLDFLANPHVRNLLDVKTEHAMQEIMKEIFSLMARFIYIRSLLAGESIFTTIVLAKRWIDQRGRLLATIAHLGNSRAYLRTGNEFRLQTADHTVMADYLKTAVGSMQGVEEWLTRIDEIRDPEELQTFLHELGLSKIQTADFLRGKEHITTSFGMHPDANRSQMTPAISTFEVKPGDELWLITDGGHNNVFFREARAIARSDHSLEARIDFYFAVARQHIRENDGPVLGGNDDIAVGVLVV